MSAAEAAAVEARLDAQSLAGGAHDSRPSSAAYPYVVIYMDGGVGFADREADRNVRRTIRFQTTTVGASPGQCRAALDRVVGALEEWVPTVTGRSCSEVEHLGAQPIRPDEELADRTVFYATDQWSFVSDPA